jgi:hypothetical protein
MECSAPDSCVGETSKSSRYMSCLWLILLDHMKLASLSHACCMIHIQNNCTEYFLANNSVKNNISQSWNFSYILCCKVFKRILPVNFSDWFVVILTNLSHDIFCLSRVPDILLYISSPVTFPSVHVVHTPCKGLWLSCVTMSLNYHLFFPLDIQLFLWINLYFHVFPRECVSITSSINCFPNSLPENSLLCLAISCDTRKLSGVAVSWNLFWDGRTFLSFEFNADNLASLILAYKNIFAQYP